MPLASKQQLERLQSLPLVPLDFAFSLQQRFDPPLAAE
jgi:hypothetical protein